MTVTLDDAHLKASEVPEGFTVDDVVVQVAQRVRRMDDEVGSDPVEQVGGGGGSGSLSLQQLDRYAVTPGNARAFAQQGGLRSQSIALAWVFMVSSGCMSASQTMPSECAPELRGISQNQ